MKRTIIAGIAALGLAVGVSSYAVAHSDHSHTEADSIAVDVANDALGEAMDRIGHTVWTECGKGPAKCDAILEGVRSLGLNWGGEKYPVTFFEDGSWSIEGDK